MWQVDDINLSGTACCIFGWDNERANNPYISHRSGLKVRLVLPKRISSYCSQWTQQWHDGGALMKMWRHMGGSGTPDGLEGRKMHTPWRVSRHHKYSWLSFSYCIFYVSCIFRWGALRSIEIHFLSPLFGDDTCWGSNVGYIMSIRRHMGARLIWSPVKFGHCLLEGSSMHYRTQPRNERDDGRVERARYD